MKASAPQTAPPPSTQLRTLVSRGSCVVTQLFASLVVGLSAAIVFCDNASLSQEPASVSAPIVATSEVPSNEIKQLVKDLEYPDEVARDFVQMVSRWKDTEGRAVLAVLKQQINHATQDANQGKISKDQLARVEEDVARRLAQRIQQEIKQEKRFDLPDVLKHKQANCLGYTHLFYILGNSASLSVTPIQVVSYYSINNPAGLSVSETVGHVACLVCLANDKKVMVDLAQAPTPMLSTPFDLETAFKKVGYYWELKDRGNPLRIHGKMQLIDRAGLIAFTYSNRGTTCDSAGKYTEALAAYTKAIELNPTCAVAYFNRGNACDSLGKHRDALAAYTKAIELNPTFVIAYCNRGNACANLRKHTEALAAYTKAIELNPQLTEAYNNRAIVYRRLGKNHEAITDCSKAIALNPNKATLYCTRGNAYDSLGEYTEALADYSRAIRLNPKDADLYGNRGDVYMSLHNSNQALNDYNKAVKLNPMSAVAYLRRGVFYATTKAPTRAKKDLRKAVELDQALEPRVKTTSDKYDLHLYESKTSAGKPTSGRSTAVNARDREAELLKDIAKILRAKVITNANGELDLR